MLGSIQDKLPESLPEALRIKVISRIIAKIIDLVIVIAVAAILPYPLGPILGFLYSILADGFRFKMFNGQSVGKKIVGFRVVHLPTGEPASWRDSALRNAPVGVATFFAIIPVWGWLILGLVGIPLMVMEIYLMLSVKAGRRLGDAMGDTEVVPVQEKEGP